MEFPEGMETIEGGAFCAYGDNINNTKISLPSTIKLIDGAFGTDNIEIHNIRFIE
ncbi:MAG: hypothetical protein K2L48_00515 [Mycoplasmoidaceae bacterium]|nr:hypothetical protein [Mycoplasmoidaceae bacterium]